MYEAGWILGPAVCRKSISAANSERRLNKEITEERRITVQLLLFDNIYEKMTCILIQLALKIYCSKVHCL